ncbi:MAG: hypothetical protein A2144_00255 [Chloroflexi bacterium RBG_16_50_9]|nr:MAG: hypothetical protein A2144_00255 [Chloroflexi bacterium RBG_16_50_9]
MIMSALLPLAWRSFIIIGKGQCCRCYLISGGIPRVGIIFGYENLIRKKNNTVEGDLFDRRW